MFVEHVETRNFRNLATTALTLSPRTVVLRGDNAQGKTNLLEALYVCATGRSFRNATSQQLLTHGQETGFIKARFVRQGVRHDVEVILNSRRRGVRVDGRALRQASKLLELVNVVAFFPDDLRIAKGSPDERRKFLDRVVANYRPAFVDAALAYGRVLKSRNTLLKAPQNPDPLTIEVYNKQLVEYGSQIHQHRFESLQDISPFACERFNQIMSTKASLDLRLLTGLGGDEELSPQEYGAAFSQALLDSYSRDRARGITSVGPHRGDIQMLVDGDDARLYASQGQQRAIVLALKLAEVGYLTTRLGSPPILLLDDVSSELDKERTSLLFQGISEVAGQVWVSTTGAAPLPLCDETQILGVSEGRIAPFLQG